MLEMFAYPQMFTKYPDSTYRFVSNDPISVGDTVVIAKVYNTQLKKWVEIKKEVLEIVEERKSRGQFIHEFNRPLSYRLKVSA